MLHSFQCSFRQSIAQFPQQIMGSFKPIEKKGKCVKKCQFMMVALYIVATMFSKPHFILYVGLGHTQIALKNYILKIDLQNEGATKLRTFFKKRPHNHLFEKTKQNIALLIFERWAGDHGNHVWLLCELLA